MLTTANTAWEKSAKQKPTATTKAPVVAKLPSTSTAKKAEPAKDGKASVLDTKQE